MTPERLEDIRRRSDNYGHRDSILAQDRRELLAEVDQIRAQVAAVRAAVDAVDQTKSASIMVSAVYRALAQR